MTQPSAACLLIGNELLSGRTQDKNFHYLAQQLMAHGIALCEARVVRDEEPAIVEAVNALRHSYTYVFTSGGIGPTHDDITSASIARAFGVPFGRNAEAEAILYEYYGDEINDVRLSMADMPEAVKLIPNPVSAAPGFVKENVFVMAGVPRIFQAMVDHVRATLESGTPILSESITVHAPESRVANELKTLQEVHSDVEIGSYPFMRNGMIGTSLVVRGTEKNSISDALGAIRWMLDGLNITYN